MTRQLLFVAASMLAAGQTPGVRMSVPSLGYIFDDAAKGIRRISGVPGAANLEETLSTPSAMGSAFVHSGARVGIANLKDGGVAIVSWSTVSWTSGPSVTPLDTTLGSAVQVAFNRAGDRAAITDGVGIEVWSGLGGQPTLTASFHPDGGVAAVALSGDGLLAAASRGGPVLLYGADARVIAPSGNWTSLAFLPNGADLLAGDAAANTLTLIRDVQGAASPSTLVALDQKPGAVAVSTDGSRALVESGGDLVLVNLDGSGVRTIPCHCAGATFDSLQGNQVVHVSIPGAHWLLDADSPEPQLTSLPQFVYGAAQ